jgi:hypothetical protein
MTAIGRGGTFTTMFSLVRSSARLGPVWNTWCSRLSSPSMPITTPRKQTWFGGKTALAGFVVMYRGVPDMKGEITQAPITSSPDFAAAAG